MSNKQDKVIDLEDYTKDDSPIILSTSPRSSASLRRPSRTLLPVPLPSQQLWWP